MKNQYLTLCLVTQINQSLESYKNFLMQVLKGGVTSVQLRIKGQKLMDFHDFAREIKILLQAFKVPLIINDDVEFAREIDADGVHLGQSDRLPLDARELLGPKKIIGWSIETMEQLHLANELSCINYVAASAVFPSRTKTDCKTIWGIEGLKNIVEFSRHPVVAIGGINFQNVKEVMRTGVDGVAVVSALHDAEDPKKTTEKFIEEINNEI
ncbi:MAG TPA: thiamine phosphate synthase [Gammaproteobacteria bacterium]|nr:thiamine phosphate synthase [Gammaproteobacteria bacterium]